MLARLPVELETWNSLYRKAKKLVKAKALIGEIAGVARNLYSCPLPPSREMDFLPTSRPRTVPAQEDEVVPQRLDRNGILRD